MADLFEQASTLLTDYILVVALMCAALFFTIVTGGVQFRMITEMLRVVFRPDKGISKSARRSGVSTFQSFAISIAARVGTGNVAGVATAIVIGGPGAVFWMWVIALLGAATAFVESTLAQIFKVKSGDVYMGGPAYYISRGLGSRPWAILFAILLIATFPLAQTTLQANTIATAFQSSFGIAPICTAIVLCAVSFMLILGGIRRISQFAQVVVPVMAVGYLAMALVILIMAWDKIPQILSTIVQSAFGFGQAAGGAVGMGIVMGTKRGLFSNEAGEGSTPIAAAAATTSHPVKQGLAQALGVYLDTLLLCTATAMTILCSGLFDQGHDGIVLTQHAIDHGLGAGNIGSTFVTLAVLFFAYTSIVANFYYGETNLCFILKRNRPAVITLYRVLACGVVMLGCLMSLETVWKATDVTMALMTLCNLSAILPLSRYAVVALHDYRMQLRQGRDPVFKASTLPGRMAKHIECW